MRESYIVSFNIHVRVIARSEQNAKDEAVFRLADHPEEYFIMDDSITGVKLDTNCPIMDSEK